VALRQTRVQVLALLAERFDRLWGVADFGSFDCVVRKCANDFAQDDGFGEAGEGLFGFGFGSGNEEEFAGGLAGFEVAVGLLGIG
jgi:hypothetical protein